MTSVWGRFRNILTELSILKEVLNDSKDYPPCCLTFHPDGKISCDLIGPLPKEEFLRECRKCRVKIESFLRRLDGLEKLEKIEEFKANKKRIA